MIAITYWKRREIIKERVRLGRAVLIQEGKRLQGTKLGKDFRKRKKRGLLRWRRFGSQRTREWLCLVGEVFRSRLHGTRSMKLRLCGFHRQQPLGVLNKERMMLVWGLLRWLWWELTLRPCSFKRLLSKPKSLLAGSALLMKREWQANPSGGIHRRSLRYNQISLFNLSIESMARLSFKYRSKNSILMHNSPFSFHPSIGQALSFKFMVVGESLAKSTTNKLEEQAVLPIPNTRKGSNTPPGGKNPTLLYRVRARNKPYSISTNSRKID